MCSNRTPVARKHRGCQRSNGCSDNITKNDCSNSYGTNASWVQNEFCSQGCKAPAAATGGGLKTVETNFTPIKPLLQINIPTVNFSDIKVQGETGSRYVDIPYLAEYIKGVFNYALGFLAMLAVIALMIGGTKYILARGNPGAIGQAKTMMGNAVFGLILGLASFVILNAVSPSLTNLSTLRTPYLERTVFDFESTVFDKTTENQGNVSTIPAPGDLGKIFQSYADCYGFDPNLLTAIASAESGLKSNAGEGKKYQGLFQMDIPYCNGGLSLGKYPASIGLSCDNRIDP